MKKVFDMNYLIKEAEENFIQKPTTKTKTQDEYHDFIIQFLDFFNKNNEPNINKVKTLSNKQIEEYLSPREQYTLKKEILDQLSQSLFNLKQNDFFSNAVVIKFTKNGNFPLAESLLKKNQIAYIYLNIQPQSTIKFTKNSQVVDPVDGSIYELESYYQGIEKNIYPAIIDSLNIFAEIPLYVGIVILNKLS